MESDANVGDDGKLMELVDKANNLKKRSEMGLECTSEVRALITSSEEYAQNIDTPTATYWDMKILHSSSMALNFCLQTVTSVLGVFDADVFGDNLAEFVKDVSVDGRERQDWTRVESIAADSFKYAPSVTFLLGTMERTEPAEKPQRQRSQRQRMSNEPFKNPRGLEQARKEEVDMEERMRHITTVLVDNYLKNGRKPVDYFSFVLDPDSYPKTVENIFHVSHLVREGMLQLNLSDEHTLPTLAPAKRNKRGEGSQTPNLWHVCFRVTMPKWEELKEKIPIKKAVI